MRVPPIIAVAAIIVVLLPVLLAAPRLVGTGVYGLLHGGGRAAGIAGMTCLLMAGILSVRIPGLDPRLGGLTAVWRLHHLLGAAAFLLLMAHPLLLALAAASTSPEAALDVLWPPFDAIAVWMGWLALLAMMIFLAPSFWFFGRPHYQRWKSLHLLSGVALVSGLTHTLLLDRAIPNGTIFWSTFGALAILVFLYRTVFSQWISPYRYRVAAAVPLTRDVVELTLKPEQRPIRYRAGQFVYLRHFDAAVAAGYNEEHPYTLSSSPAEEKVRIGIKALGDASSAMARLQPGTVVTLEGPYGRFFPLKSNDEGQLWIGGGIGITPFVSRTRDLAHRHPPCDIQLVYCANRPERAYYQDELREIASKVTGFSFHGHYFNEQGPLDLDFLRGICPDFAQREVFICGPPPMTEHLIRLLRTAGIARQRIHTEAFDLL